MVKKYALLLVLLVLAACSVKSIAPDTPAQVDPREQELRAAWRPRRSRWQRNLLARRWLRAIMPPIAGILTTTCAKCQCPPGSLRHLMTDSLQETTRGCMKRGKCQVNKIETYPDMLHDLLFCEVSAVCRPRDPVTNDS